MNTYRLWGGTQKERDHYEDQDVEGGVDNVKMDLGENGWGDMDWSGSGRGQVEGSCECSNELSGSIKCWEVLEWMHNWWFLK
jgi:hypothetical protein